MTALSRSLRSIRACPPRRSCTEIAGIHFASSSFEMYFGKLVKNCQPKTGMSNMLWWFDTMMYEVCGRMSGERSTSMRMPARCIAPISVVCSAPMT